MKLDNNLKTILASILLIVAVSAGLFIISRREVHVEVNQTEQSTNSNQQVPRLLRAAFPKTDFSKSSVDFSQIISGGPGRDGIPALSNPQFIPLSEADVRDQIQAIVVQGNTQTKIYPYNILNWHEIVNDYIDDKPIAVTFCPLCGSAIVFNRNTSLGLTEFGVSGYLLESNLIMYDQNSESFWQQSTGEAIVGQLLGEELTLESMQLLTIAEIKQLYPEAIIMSTQTGYERDYQRNPYSGYSDNDSFYFAPSVNDQRYPAKDIFIATKVNGLALSMPYRAIIAGSEFSHTTKLGDDISILYQDGEVIIQDNGQTIPHYYEMWFSWATQHHMDDKAEVFDPSQ